MCSCSPQARSNYPSEWVKSISLHREGRRRKRVRAWKEGRGGRPWRCWKGRGGATVEIWAWGKTSREPDHGTNCNPLASQARSPALKPGGWREDFHSPRKRMNIPPTTLISPRLLLPPSVHRASPSAWPDHCYSPWMDATEYWMLQNSEYVIFKRGFCSCKD